MSAYAQEQRAHWNPATLLLLGLLAAALGLRLWGTWFGLPYLFHNDEDFEIVRALQLGAGQYDFDRVGKGGYFYLLFVEYGLLFVVLLLSGAVSSAAEFGELYIRDPSAFYLIGRATTATIGTLTVYLVYRLGGLAYSTAAALFAATLLTFNVLHSYLSHLTIVDVPMTFLIVAALYFAAKLVTGGSARNYWWAALMAAFATSTKIPAILVLIPLLISHCYFVTGHGGVLRQYFLSKSLWQAVAIFVIAYVVTTPGILVHFEDVLSGGVSKFLTDADVAEGGLDERSKLANTNLFVYYYTQILQSMTWPVFIVSAAGVLYAVWKHRPVDVMLVTFAAVWYVAMASSTDPHLFFPRYIAPVLPVTALLGGRFLADIVSIAGRDRRPAVAATALGIALVAFPAFQIAETNQLMLKIDTRAIAKEWFDENVPPGSKVLIEGSRTVVSNATIPLQNTAENLRESIEFYREREPGKARYFRMALKTLPNTTYDLVPISFDNVRALQDYKNLGVQYLVLRPEEYRNSRLRYDWPDLVETIRRDPDVELIKRFEPTEENSASSPVIEVYRVNSNIASSGQLQVTATEAAGT